MSTPNIGPRERRKRKTLGIASGALGVALLATLLVTGAPRIWRLVVFAPFIGAAVGVLQAREKT